MKKDKINGYALALFSLAKEEKKLIKAKDDAFAVIDALKQNEEYLHIIRSKAIDQKVIQDLINQAFKGIDSNIKNFLLLTASKGDTVMIPHTLEKFIKYANEELGIKEGIVYSVEKLSPLDLKNIEKRVSKQFGYKPTLTNKIDKELVSGIKIVINDEVIEDSVVSRLEQIKYELLREEN